MRRTNWDLSGVRAYPRVLRGLAMALGIPPSCSYVLKFEIPIFLWLEVSTGFMGKMRLAYENTRGLVQGRQLAREWLMLSVLYCVLSMLSWFWSTRLAGHPRFLPAARVELFDSRGLSDPRILNHNNTVIMILLCLT
ncbi:hypothetical protein DL95DRAFT_383833 [Leptodontidium sp. 2 PMI_412]|nr:hypothetical protein BKA61DRAFT_44764 [Leptodontidium sp. MPI-SDFR-AT-0119]KAH9220016.1 hypothetical protein DL95DRAFT_383833 [Leptodontidium sp. 2 PMI_412]